MTTDTMPKGRRICSIPSETLVQISLQSQSTTYRLVRSADITSVTLPTMRKERSKSNSEVRLEATPTNLARILWDGCVPPLVLPHLEDGVEWPVRLCISFSSDDVTIYGWIDYNDCDVQSAVRKILFATGDFCGFGYNFWSYFSRESNHHKLKRNLWREIIPLHTDPGIKYQTRNVFF